MYRLIVNPAAGIGNGEKTGKIAIDYLKSKNVDFDVVYTEKGGDHTAQARKAVEDGIQTVIVLGGDGTVSVIARGLLYSKTSLGIVPCGTGNDFIKAAGIPKDPIEALELILTKPATPIDSCLINDLFFVNVAGCGFDVTTLDYAETAKKYVKGIAPYLYGVIRSIANFHPFPMTIRIDGKDYSRPSLICAVANGTHFGGGMPITPMAKINDGKLDVLIVDAVNKRKIIKYLPTLLKGTLYKNQFAHHFLAEEVFISMPNMRIELDGEVIPVDSCHFTIQKQSILLHH